MFCTLDKECHTCHERLPLSEFGVDRSRADGLTYRCRICTRTWDREYSRLKRYGLAPTDHKMRLSEQAGVCAICHRTNENGRALSVDHDHETGVVRGLLCSNCNTMIGLAQESTETLAAAIEYLNVLHIR